MINKILDKLKDDDWYDELDLTKDKWIELKQTETKQILDYITNLQEENERLKENNLTMQEEMARTWEKCDDYKSRCEKAIEKLKLCNSKCAKETINILQNGSDSE